jgi:DnaA regulatory inactivator Hda
MTFAFPPGRDDRFETFLTDERNRETVSLCRRFVDAPPSLPASLVLHGPAGCGKTHLLGAMGDVAKRRLGGGAWYLSTVDLAADVADTGGYEALKGRLAGYEAALFLAVDDLEAAVALPDVQEQIFHLFNAVTQSGGIFVAAADRPPARLGFADYLETRLLWGQALDLKPVADETWEKVLVNAAAARGLTLPEAAARWMVTRIARDPASQLTALERVDRRSLTTGRKVSVQLVREALEENDDL